MSKKQNSVFLIGPMGAGKTSIGRQLAKDLGMDFYDSDEVIEQRTGADIPWIFDIEGEEGFRKREQKVLEELTQLAGIVLSTGGGTVGLAENRALLAANGVVVYLRTTLKDQMERTSRSKKRPLSREEKKRRELLSKFQVQHGHLYEDLADLVYDTDKCSVRHVAREIVNKLLEEEYI